MERNISVQALVTSSRNFGEMHRSVNLLSPQLGNVNVIIFGGRKGKNASLAPLFSYGTFLLYHDTVKDEYSLKEESLDFVAERINSDLNAIYTASYFCEAVNCIKSDDCENIYELLKQAVTKLEENPEKHRKILIDFTWKLLLLSGVGSDLSCCPSCEKPYKDEETVHFSTSLITPVCESCADNHEILLPPGARRYLKYTEDMSFSEALNVQLYETAESRISIFLLKWLTVFCGRSLYTIQSGLL